MEAGAVTPARTVLLEQLNDYCDCGNDCAHRNNPVRYVWLHFHLPALRCLIVSGIYIIVSTFFNQVAKKIPGTMPGGKALKIKAYADFRD